MPKRSPTKCNGATWNIAKGHIWLLSLAFGQVCSKLSSVFSRWARTQCPSSWWRRAGRPVGLGALSSLYTPPTRGGCSLSTQETVCSSPSPTPPPWTWTRRAASLGPSSSAKVQLESSTNSSNKSTPLQWNSLFHEDLPESMDKLLLTSHVLTFFFIDGSILNQLQPGDFSGRSLVETLKPAKGKTFSIDNQHLYRHYLFCERDLGVCVSELYFL